MFAKAVLAACCLMALGEAASACVCDPNLTTKKLRGQAEAVFAGTVLESHREFGPDGLEWRVRLKVDDFWKGDLGEEVIVYTDASDCAVSFERGQKYLVFARRQEGRGRLVTNVCMKSGPLDSRAEDVAKLGRPRQRPAREL